MAERSGATTEASGSYSIGSDEGIKPHSPKAAPKSKGAKGREKAEQDFINKNKLAAAKANVSNPKAALPKKRGAAGVYEDTRNGNNPPIPQTHPSKAPPPQLARRVIARAPPEPPKKVTIKPVNESTPQPFTKKVEEALKDDRSKVLKKRAKEARDKNAKVKSNYDELQDIMRLRLDIRGADTSNQDSEVLKQLEQQARLDEFKKHDDVQKKLENDQDLIRLQIGEIQALKKDIKGLRTTLHLQQAAHLSSGNPSTDSSDATFTFEDHAQKHFEKHLTQKYFEKERSDKQAAIIQKLGGEPPVKSSTPAKSEPKSSPKTSPESSAGSKSKAKAAKATPVIEERKHSKESFSFEQHAAEHFANNPEKTTSSDDSRTLEQHTQRQEQKQARKNKDIIAPKPVEIVTPTLFNLEADAVRRQQQLELQRAQREIRQLQAAQAAGRSIPTGDPELKNVRMPWTGNGTGGFSGQTMELVDSHLADRRDLSPQSRRRVVEPQASNFNFSADLDVNYHGQNISADVDIHYQQPPARSNDIPRRLAAQQDPSPPFRYQGGMISSPTRQSSKPFQNVGVRETVQVERLPNGSLRVVDSDEIVFHGDNRRDGRMSSNVLQGSVPFRQHRPPQHLNPAERALETAPSPSFQNDSRRSSEAQYYQPPPQVQFKEQIRDVRSNSDPSITDSVIQRAVNVDKDLAHMLEEVGVPQPMIDLTGPKGITVNKSILSAESSRSPQFIPRSPRAQVHGLSSHPDPPRSPGRFQGNRSDWATRGGSSPRSDKSVVLEASAGEQLSVMPLWPHSANDPQLPGPQVHVQHPNHIFVQPHNCLAPVQPSAELASQGLIPGPAQVIAINGPTGVNEARHAAGQPPTQTLTPGGLAPSQQATQTVNQGGLASTQPVRGQSRPSHLSMSPDNRVQQAVNALPTDQRLIYQQLPQASYANTAPLPNPPNHLLSSTASHFIPPSYLPIEEMTNKSRITNQFNNSQQNIYIPPGDAYAPNPVYTYAHAPQQVSFNLPRQENTQHTIRTIASNVLPQGAHPQAVASPQYQGVQPQTVASPQYVYPYHATKVYANTVPTNNDTSLFTEAKNFVFGKPAEPVQGYQYYPVIPHGPPGVPATWIPASTAQADPDINQQAKSLIERIDKTGLQLGKTKSTLQALQHLTAPADQNACSNQ